jgi:hypothetical protein
VRRIDRHLVLGRQRLPGWLNGSVVTQLVNVSGRLEPRRASSAASRLSRAAIQLFIGVALSLAVKYVP